ncbi:MAG: DUF4091 domain-containing protein [Armatimonadota bacterium]
MLTVWPVDSLVKVFPDDLPPASPAVQIELLAARGAFESGQLAFRADEDAGRFEIAIEPPVSADGTVLAGITWRKVEFVPVHRPTFVLHPSQRLRNGPSFFPDPLLDEEALADAYHVKGYAGYNPMRDVPGGVTIPIWLTLQVPVDAVPGRYEGAVTVSTAQGEARLPLVVQVSPAVCPAERTLKLTHWFFLQNFADGACVQKFDEAWWQVVEQWARCLAEHRANVALTPLTELLQLSRDNDGTLHIDFSRFDRWVELLQQAGLIGYIEGGHLAGRVAEWDGPFGLNAFIIHRTDGMEESLKGVLVDSPQAAAFLGELLPPLVAHLRERGWLSIYFQHMADEPVAGNAASYRALSDLVKTNAPELPRLDATMADASLVGTATIWCPQSKEAEEELTFFKERQAAGEEVWHYTCLAPNGRYPNRFIHQPLLAVRVLHWFNYTAGLTGYLHWGFNYWTGFNTPGAPYCDTESTTIQGRLNLPAGDTHIAYPGPGGRPLDSIRHEMVREGVQDYELLKVLDAARPQDVQRLAKIILPSLIEYEKDPVRFRQVRAELLALVAEVQ